MKSNDIRWLVIFHIRHLRQERRSRLCRTIDNEEHLGDDYDNLFILFVFGINNIYS
jgi:hypothetical protein